MSLDVCEGKEKKRVAVSKDHLKELIMDEKNAWKEYTRISKKSTNAEFKRMFREMALEEYMHGDNLAELMVKSKNKKYKK